MSRESNNKLKFYYFNYRSTIMDIGYIDKGKFVVYLVYNKDLIYWSVCSSSKRVGDGVKVVNWGIVI